VRSSRLAPQGLDRHHVYGRGGEEVLRDTAEHSMCDARSGMRAHSHKVRPESGDLIADDALNRAFQ